MNHKPFEDWLFSEEPLTSDEKAALQGHLQSCETCRMTAAAWQEVEASLKQAPPVAPEPGFTARWEARLEAERQRMLRRQALAILAFNVGAAALLFASIFIFAWPVLEAPKVLISTWFYRMLSLVSTASVLQRTFVSIAETVAGIIPPVGWVLFVGIASEVAVLWLVSMRLIAFPRRVTE